MHSTLVSINLFVNFSHPAGAPLFVIFSLGTESIEFDEADSEGNFPILFMNRIRGTDDY